VIRRQLIDLAQNFLIEPAKSPGNDKTMLDSGTALQALERLEKAPQILARLDRTHVQDEGEIQTVLFPRCLENRPFVNWHESSVNASVYEPRPGRVMHRATVVNSLRVFSESAVMKSA